MLADLEIEPLSAERQLTVLAMVPHRFCFNPPWLESKAKDTTDEFHTHDGACLSGTESNCP